MKTSAIFIPTLFLLFLLSACQKDEITAPAATTIPDPTDQGCGHRGPGEPTGTCPTGDGDQDPVIGPLHEGRLVQ